MRSDLDLERLEERVRKAFPACQHPPIIIPQREPIPQAPFFPETSLDCWSRYLMTIPAIRLSETPQRITVVVHSPEQS